MGRRRRARPQTTADGWSTIPGQHVPAPPGPSLATAFRAAVLEHRDSSSSAPAPSPPSADCLARKRADVRQCPALAKVLATARDALRGHVDRIVLLGLGSLAAGVTPEISYLQLALGLELQAALARSGDDNDDDASEDRSSNSNSSGGRGEVDDSKDGGGDDGRGLPKLYLQDPAFTALDAGFLAALPQTTVLPFVKQPEPVPLETTTATPMMVAANYLPPGLVGASTLLYAPHLEYWALVVVLRDRPLAALCNDLSFYVDRGVGRHLESEHAILGWYLDEARFASMPMPPESVGGGRAFNSTSLYWRHPSTPKDDVDGEEQKEGPAASGDADKTSSGEGKGESSGDRLLCLQKTTSSDAQSAS